MFGIEQVKKVITDKVVRKRLEDKVTLISKLSPLIAGNLDGNPRQIKRFLNTFILRKKLADVAKLADFKDDVLAKLMILEYAEPNMFADLYSWQAQNKGYAQELKKFEKKNEDGEHEIEDKYKLWKDAKIIKWLDSEPFLANIDLRDYFWISRDRLESMKDSMTPPVVTQIIMTLMVKGQSDNLLHQKIKTDVLGLQDNLQHELYSQLARRASANSAERKQIFNLYEFMIEDGCACGNEFRSMCSSVGFKKTPALKLIVERIAESHLEYKDLMN